MPMSNIYGTSTDVESDGSLPPLGPSNHYVDPWDLENYAYLKEHLELEAPSHPNPSSLEDFVEAHSSFDYVPVLTPRNYTDTVTSMRYETLMTDQRTYACIDELGLYEKTRPQSDFIYEVAPKRNYHHGRHSDIRAPLYNSSKSIKQQYEGDRGKRQPPSIKKNGNRDRSVSFAYGDGYEPYERRPSTFNIAKNTDDEEIYYPIYDDPRCIRKPENFGLSSYGHLKIDYSYSWNNLNKYIVG